MSGWADNMGGWRAAWRWTALAVLITAGAGLAVWLARRPDCGDAAGPLPPQPPVRFGLSLQPPSALAMIAVHQHLFRRHGLEVNVTNYVSGARALEGLLKGDVDIVTCAEVPVALAGFSTNELRILASIGATNDEPRIIARTDRGIAEPADLAGRRIGTQRGSAVHFFLHLFLNKHGMQDSDVNIIFLRAEELGPALIAGDIDAFSMREPYIGDAARELRGNAVVFTEPGLYARRELVVARAPWLARSQAAMPILRALREAAQYARAQPDTAARTVADTLGGSFPEILALWPDLHLDVKLEQALLMQLEDEARWMRESGLADAGGTADFLGMISPGPLLQLDPEAVSVIGANPEPLP